MRLYYCKSDNFGDALNEYIFKKCFNVDITHSDIYKCDAIGIGSVLERLLIQTKDWNNVFNLIKNKNAVYVLSSGFGRDDECYMKKIRFLYMMKFKRKVEIVSLRGELAKLSVEKIIGEKLNNVFLGDLGLLVSYLIKENNDKIYDLGIVPHYADINNPIFNNIKKQVPNSIILSTRGNPIKFLNELNKCKTVILTGLHPLIASDSLGIPNLWCRVSENTTPRHKYADYYSIYNLQINPINLLENNIITPEFIKESYQINYDTVQKIKENIFAGHQKFFANNKF